MISKQERIQQLLKSKEELQKQLDLLNSELNSIHKKKEEILLEVLNGLDEERIFNNVIIYENNDITIYAKIILYVNIYYNPNPLLSYMDIIKQFIELDNIEINIEYKNDNINLDSKMLLDCLIISFDDIDNLCRSNIVGRCIDTYIEEIMTRLKEKYESYNLKWEDAIG